MCGLNPDSGEPPTLEPVSKRLALDPTLRFKLDATSSWTPEIFDELIRTEAVDSIDFKGMYKGTSVDQSADPVLYRRVVEAFPDAWLEDPDLSSAEAMAVLADQHHRITWDAPIHAIADIEALPFAPRMVNIKPSRIGKLSGLCDTYDYCTAHEIGAYGGGQTELGVGRGQAQYLTSLFHPDTPNDLAPGAYNQMDPPAGLPRSPLTRRLHQPRLPGGGAGRAARLLKPPVARLVHRERSEYEQPGPDEPQQPRTKHLMVQPSKSAVNPDGASGVVVDRAGGEEVPAEREYDGT